MEPVGSAAYARYICAICGICVTRELRVLTNTINGNYMFLFILSFNVNYHVIRR